MLVVANGADKCGSTWLASIILELVQPLPLPNGYHDALHGSIPTIKGNMIRRFLDEVDYVNCNYVSKNHFYYEYPFFARRKGVYVIDITRDMADMLISLFFASTPKMATATLEEVRAAYWEYGPPIVEFVVRYHSIWGQPSDWTYMSSYQRLKEDPIQEIADVAAFLGLQVTRDRIRRIVEETEFGKLSEKLSPFSGMEKRFRKGVVGDHKNYFDGPILDDIRRIEAANAEYPKGLAAKASFWWLCHKFAGRDAPPPYRAKLQARKPAAESVSAQSQQTA